MAVGLIFDSGSTADCRVSVSFPLHRSLGDSIFDVDSGRSGDSGSSAPTQHFTMIFNSFVMMTVFNEINARKIHGQRNIFEGLARNHIFVAIWTGTFIAQVVQIIANLFS